MLPYLSTPDAEIPGWRDTKAVTVFVESVIGGQDKTKTFITGDGRVNDDFSPMSLSDEEVKLSTGSAGDAAKRYWLLAVIVYSDFFGNRWRLSAQYRCFHRLGVVRLEQHTDEPYSGEQST